MTSAFNNNAQPTILRVFQSKEQTKAFYNKISRFYDVLSERSEAPMRSAGLDLLKARIGESVLEIGFGTGHCLVALAKAVGPKGRVFRLNLSDQMVKLAKANLAKTSLLEHACLRRGDAAQLPYANDSLDEVFTPLTFRSFPGTGGAPVAALDDAEGHGGGEDADDGA